ncbi:hypothetical protein H0H93_014848 [Arthromyces matolae]|nr:hypothetical protein H0H93_014848 [Arthromyces matolae]
MPWDSAELGITFEKPTGLASQLQKNEDLAPESMEFERLKEHFEPFIRATSLSSSTTTASAVAPSSAAHSHHLYSSSITAAASAALARDIPGVGKYNPLGRSTSKRGKAEGRNKDEMVEYKSRLDISVSEKMGAGGGEGDVDFMKHLETIEEVASLEQRWTNSWAIPLQARDLRPLRIPLHSKRSKRCPACTHILIKPEQKAQSVRYKIKLVAANYLPAITVSLPHLQQAQLEAARKAPGKVTIQDDDKYGSITGMQAGKTYPFHLALTNPLYDPIQVRLSVQRMHIAIAAGSSGDGGTTEKARRPPFAVSLPTSAFPIAPFAEAWEYEDDEEMYGVDDDDDLAAFRSNREKDRSKVKAVGVLEKRANITVVGGEVVIGKEARGSVKFNIWRTTMASIASSSTTIDLEGQRPGTPRSQAAPLPTKRGEIGYVEGRQLEEVDISSPGDVLPARHPADRDPPAPSTAASTSLDTPSPAVSNNTLVYPSTSTLLSSESNNSAAKAKLLRLLKPKKAFFGLRLTTLLAFFLQLVILGGTFAGWVIVVKLVAQKTSNAFNTTSIFMHVIFAVCVFAQLLFLERRVFRLRAERWTYLHPGQILPISRNGRPMDATIAFSPWNRPPLPTYAAALAQSGAGTGDVEDHMIAVAPPPAYGNTRGSTLLLSGFLRDSLRAQRPTSPSESERRQSGQSQMNEMRQIERPKSYVSRDDEWEEIQDAARARQLEETLGQLERRPSSRSSP